MERIGAVGGFVQRGIAGAADLQTVIEMGGDGAESDTGRATETSLPRLQDSL